MQLHFIHRTQLRNYTIIGITSTFGFKFAHSLSSISIQNNHSPVEVSESPKAFSDSLSLRIERLQWDESVISAFQSWMGDGFAVHRGGIFHAINRLRKLRMNKRALQVMEWIMMERPYKLKELDYAYLLEFTAKFHGISEAESLFLRIPDEFRNELLYSSLVMACLDKGLIRLSLAYMQIMRELSLPISPCAYNRLIVLRSTSGCRKRIPNLLRQMKADGILPHTSTYNILLKIEANNHNIEELSKVFNRMKQEKVDPNEITLGIMALAHAVARLHMVSETYVEAIEKVKTGTNWSTLDILLILYGYLDKHHELERTWKLVQALPHVRLKSFCLVIEAFGRAKHVDRAEAVWAEMKSVRPPRLTSQYNSIISVYCRHGLVDRASNILKEMRASGCKPDAITYRHLASGCLKAGLAEEALKALEMGKDEKVSCRVRRSTSWLETTLMLVEGFADLGDVNNAKRFFRVFKETKYCRYTFVYNSLLRAHVKGKVYDPEFLRNMILSGARPDAETYSLWRLLEGFKV